MPQALTIRQLPDDVHQALKARAARAGRSVEAEVRDILEMTCLPSAPDGSWQAGLRQRAQTRTASPQSDSTALIRAERDARGR